jgi:hypothetical protein
MRDQGGVGRLDQYHLALASQDHPSQGPTLPLGQRHAEGVMSDSPACKEGRLEVLHALDECQLVFIAELTPVGVAPVFDEVRPNLWASRMSRAARAIPLAIQHPSNKRRLPK